MLVQTASMLPLEYLAGFIDAEGSLMIARTHVRRYDTVQYRARVTVANTERQVLEEIQQEYGGVLVEDPRSSLAWKPAYQLVWLSRAIEPLLSVLGPHLRVKSRQAAILLDLIHHVKETPPSRTPDGRFFAPHPPDVMEFRETLYRCMRTLNAKGRVQRATPHGKGQRALSKP